jgi:hypothetical protein
MAMTGGGLGFVLPAVIGLIVLAWYVSIPILLWKILQELRRRPLG